MVKFWTVCNSLSIRSSISFITTATNFKNSLPCRIFKCSLGMSVLSKGQSNCLYRNDVNVLHFNSLTSAVFAIFQHIFLASLKGFEEGISAFRQLRNQKPKNPFPQTEQDFLGSRLLQTPWSTRNAVFILYVENK